MPVCQAEYPRMSSLGLAILFSHASKEHTIPLTRLEVFHFLGTMLGTMGPNNQKIIKLAAQSPLQEGAEMFKHHTGNSHRHGLINVELASG